MKYMGKEMKRFITHVFNEGLPERGFRKLSYITISDEVTSEIEYFLGTDNNPLSQDEIYEMVKQKTIFPIHGNFPELKKGSSLFVDSNGELFFAERYNSNSNREKLNVSVKQT